MVAAILLQGLCNENFPELCYVHCTFKIRLLKKIYLRHFKQNLDNPGQNNDDIYVICGRTKKWCCVPSLSPTENGSANLFMSR